MEVFDIIISLLLGIGLAAAVGFRVFLPLLILSIAAYFDLISLNDEWLWIGSLTTMIALAVASLLELLGYYIPWLDNALDSIAIPLAAIAGTVVLVATISDVDPIISWGLAIIAGGGTASVIKGNVSLLRLGSTATTGGIANPIVSTIETFIATTLAVLAIFIPILAFLFVLMLFYIIYKFYKKLRKKSNTSI